MERSTRPRPTSVYIDTIERVDAGRTARRSDLLRRLRKELRPLPGTRRSTADGLKSRPRRELPLRSASSAPCGVSGTTRSSTASTTRSPRVAKPRPPSNILGVSYRMRPAKGLRLEAELQARRRHQRLHGGGRHLLDPGLAALHQPVEPRDSAVRRPAPDPHRRHHGDRPRAGTKRKLALGYTFGQTQPHLVRYVYWDGDNTDGDLTDWSRSSARRRPSPSWSPGRRRAGTGMSVGPIRT